jgi:hypothetical protein
MEVSLIAKQVGCGSIDVLYMVRNLPLIERISLEDDQDAL